MCVYACTYAVLWEKGLISFSKWSLRKLLEELVMWFLVPTQAEFCFSRPAVIDAQDTVFWLVYLLLDFQVILGNQA